jgi:hypothetical protein
MAAHFPGGSAGNYVTGQILYVDEGVNADQ